MPHATASGCHDRHHRHEHVGEPERARSRRRRWPRRAPPTNAIASALQVAVRREHPRRASVGGRTHGRVQQPPRTRRDHEAPRHEAARPLYVPPEVARHRLEVDPAGASSAAAGRTAIRRWSTAALRSKKGLDGAGAVERIDGEPRSDQGSQSRFNYPVDASSTPKAGATCCRPSPRRSSAST